MSSPPKSSSLSPKHRSVPLQQSSSSSSSTPRVSSPLNPATQSSAVSPSDDITLSPTSTSSSSPRRHAHSNPSITIDTGKAGTPASSARSLPVSISSELTMTTENRGRTLAPQSKLKSREPSPAPSAMLDASWWGDHDQKSVLPWKEAQPKRKHSIPAEQLQGLEHTKQVSPFQP